MLGQSARLLELEDQSKLAQRLSQYLNSAPLDKPDDHRGPAETDMFQLTLSASECCQIHHVIARCARQGRTTPETKRRGLGGFVEAWSEYSSALNRKGT